MMKPKQIIRTLLFFALAFTAACNDDDTEDGRMTASAVIEQIEATETTVMFTLKTVDADKAYYLLAAGGGIPDAAKIVAEGTGVTADGKQTVENLEPGTGYTIYAVAENRFGTGKVASGSFRTKGTPAEGTLLTAKTAIGIYYGTKFSATNANYYFMLTDAPFENNQATGAGTIVYFDCFSTISDTPQHAIIPEGRYEYSKEVSFDAFKISSESTLMMTTDESGQITDGGYFEEGYLNVTYTEGTGYDIEGVFTRDNGEKIRIAYKGEIDFQNQSGVFGEDITVNADYAYANVVYYGDAYSAGFSEYYFEVGTMEPDNEGVPRGSGYILAFDLWGATSADSDNAILPEGSYRYGREISMNSASSDKTIATCIVPDGSAKYNILYTDGTVNVSHAGEGYSISGEFTLQDGYKLKFTYEGTLDFENQAPAESDDIDEVFTKAQGTYYGDLYGYGTANYALSFTNEDGSIELVIDMNDILDESQAPKISEGTYTLDEDFEAAAGKFYSGEDFGLGPSGTYCALKSSEETSYLYVNGGTFTVTHTEGGYSFSFDFTTTSNAKVQGSYSGKLPIEINN